MIHGGLFMRKKTGGAILGILKPNGYDIRLRFVDLPQENYPANRSSQHNSCAISARAFSFGQEAQSGHPIRRGHNTLQTTIWIFWQKNLADRPVAFSARFFCVSVLFLHQFRDALGHGGVVVGHLDVVAWEDQVNAGFGFDLVEAADPGRHVHDEGAAGILPVAPEEVGKV